MSLLPDLPIVEILAWLFGAALAGLWALVERRGRQEEKRKRREAESSVDNLRKIRELERDAKDRDPDELADRLTRR